MIKLEKEFVSGEGGFSANPLNYRQLKRTDKVALYERSRDGKIMDYEVFFITMFLKGRRVFAKVLEDDEEHYPSTGQWGKIAWTLPNFETALKRFNELENRSNIPENEEETPLTIPDGEFTVRELAENNNIEYIVASNFIKTALEIGTTKCVGEKRFHAKGKPSKLYAKA